MNRSILMVWLQLVDFTVSLQNNSPRVVNMKNSVNPIQYFGKSFVVVLLSACFLASCAELDQLMKPRVQGLQKATGFDAAALQEGGIGESHIHTSLVDDEIHINALETMFITAVRDKRRDVTIGKTGRYQITANIIADDVTQRADNFDTHYYRWSKRRVKVSYEIDDSETAEQVWSGIIETSLEEVASYEISKNDKTSDKVIDVVVAVINKKEVYPYPSPPLFSDVVKSNFEGFALNLPIEK